MLTSRFQVVYPKKSVSFPCIPFFPHQLQIMWHAADVAEKIRASSPFGFPSQPPPKFDWAQFKHRRDAYIKKLNAIYDANLVKDNVDHHEGWTRFQDSNTVQVERPDGTKYTLEADQICIAVGGIPTVPTNDTIPGAHLGINSDGFFDLEQQPKRVAVVGAGYIAVELAGIFNTLGSETHLLIRKDKVLRTFDPTLQDALTDWMAHTGINIHKSTNVVRVEGQQGGPLTVHTDTGEKIEVDTLLWAIGRQSNTADLGLNKVGVKMSQKGDIIVNEYQNTNVPHITAIGDVAGKALLTPVAIAAGRRLANRLFGPPKFKNDKLDYTNIPSVVFSYACSPMFPSTGADRVLARHPPIGTVGMTEPEARKEYGDAVRICAPKLLSTDSLLTRPCRAYPDKSSFRALYFSMLPEAHKEPSIYKLIVVGEEEKVVGMHIFGLGSDEVTQGFAVAVKMGGMSCQVLVIRH